MTKQEAYEKVREHFTQPDAQFGFDNKSEVCLYRANGDPDSKIRCGIGVLIPDMYYYRALEGKTVQAFFEDSWFQSTVVKNHHILDDEDKLDLEFAETIQSLHDNIARGWTDTGDDEATPEHFISALDKFAEKSGLKVVATEV